MAWWPWMAAALALAILETFAPAYVFLGFAVGAAAMGLLFLVGGPLAAWLSGSLALALVVFAALSLLAWVVLRSVFGSRSGDRDIND